MFVVITGLDGSGTSTIARELNKIDNNSILVRTPSHEFVRHYIDQEVRETSQVSHYLFYLSSVIYMSDFIKKHFDYKNNNVYCVRYLIDTVVSHKVAGLDVKLDYETDLYSILKPDLTIFVDIDESVRQQRITNRGKSVLDKVLDEDNTRNLFLSEFQKHLKDYVIINNSSDNLSDTIQSVYNHHIRRN